MATSTNTVAVSEFPPRPRTLPLVPWPSSSDPSHRNGYELVSPQQLVEADVVDALWPSTRKSSMQWSEPWRRELPKLRYAEPSVLNAALSLIPWIALAGPEEEESRHLKDVFEEYYSLYMNIRFDLRL
jgi:hypothetical protein